MVYPVNIVINDRNWYDSRIQESAPVVFQNINYAEGDDRSVNVVRQRYMQDWAKRIIEGVGLTAYIDTNDQIDISQGYATVGGRFIEIPANTFDCSVEILSPGDYYLVIRVESFVENDGRLPNDAAANIIGVPLPYTKSHNDLVLAKFTLGTPNITSFDDYTAIQEWQASVLSPVSAIPDLTTGSDSILLRAYGGTAGVEAIDILGVESDKTRFYLNAVFDDQTASTEVKLINNNGILETRNIGDTSYLGQDILNLLVGGTEVIDSSRNLLNIVDINARTMGGNNPTDLVDVDSTQTMSAKTLTKHRLTLLLDEILLIH